MKYIIMLAIVTGLAGADLLTGLIRAYMQNDLCSAGMRTGGLNKLCEFIVMAVSCGLEIGIEQLGNYLEATVLASVTGTVASGVVFAYIVIMELISILENYGEISPDAVWVRGIVRRLRSIERKDEQNVQTETDQTRSG